MSKTEYSPEIYWDEVAIRIQERKQESFLAGDDEPYYHYKRRLFLKLLHAMPVKGKKVLEIGSGPGGNLLEMINDQPAELTGTDISEAMVELATKRVNEHAARIIKINGENLPFENNSFDIAFTATVLQHITDDKKAAALIKEMCRATTGDIYIYERIERKRKENFSNTGRTVNEYAVHFNNGGFILQDKKFLPLQASYFVCGAIRKLFNKRNRKEGERLSRVSVLLQRVTLPVTKLLDKILKPKRGLAMLHFKKAVL